MGDMIYKHFYIDSDYLEYLKDIKENEKLSSINKALNLVLEEHKQKADTTTEIMIKIIADEVAKALKSDIENLSKGVNYSDRNIQIMLEMMNGLFIKNNIGEIITSDIVKSEALEISERAVKKKISKSRVRKINNTNY